MPDVNGSNGKFTVTQVLVLMVACLTIPEGIRLLRAPSFADQAKEQGMAAMKLQESIRQAQTPLIEDISVLKAKVEKLEKTTNPLKELEALIGRGKGRSLFGNMAGARISGNEASAIGSLKAIASSQALFREGDKEGDGTLDYATTLSELGPGAANASLIDNVLSGGTKSGYIFSLSGGVYTYTCTAQPESTGKTGKRSFFIDESAVIRYAKNGPAGPHSNAIGQ